MGRYDWPRGPRRQDDPSGRAAHLAQLRPSADVMTLPPTVAPAPRRRRSRAIPHNAPSGAEYLWTSIGPMTMTHGQATGAPNVAGRIRDLTVEPQVGKRVYAASGGGGVWFSNDAGNSWRPLDEWQISNRDAKGTISNALACGAIHVIWGDPHGDGSDDVIWVGTGEPSLRDSGAFQVGGETADWLRIGGQVGGVGF